MGYYVRWNQVHSRGRGEMNYLNVKITLNMSINKFKNMHAQEGGSKKTGCHTHLHFYESCFTLLPTRPYITLYLPHPHPLT